MKKLCALILIFVSFSLFAKESLTYPDRAKSLRITGTVDLLYDISEDGRVENVRVINANPKYVFERSVIKQVSNWRMPIGDKREGVPLHVIFKMN